jgi:S1-C subfamily serine protease
VLVAFAVLLVGIPASVTVRALQPPSAESYWPPAALSPERLVAQTVRIDTRGGGAFGTGTGVGVGPHVAITNAHLTGGPATLVTRCDTDVLSVDRIERAGGGLDLAVVVTNGEPLIPVELAAADPQPGEDVTIVGYPSGERAIGAARIEGTLTRGGETVLRFSPEPHPGQSGGPLVDANGRLVAIAYAEDTVGGQGLAIPVSRVRAELQRWEAAGIPVAPIETGDPSAVHARTGTCG